MNRLFVYGTLQPGGPNEHILAPVDGRWQSGTVKGRLVAKGWGASAGYPGLILDKNGADVPGHVLCSSELAASLDDLDRFEGDEYARVVCPVVLTDGAKVDAYVYVLREGSATGT